MYSPTLFGEGGMNWDALTLPCFRKWVILYVVGYRLLVKGGVRIFSHTFLLKQPSNLFLPEISWKIVHINDINMWKDRCMTHDSFVEIGTSYLSHAVVVLPIFKLQKQCDNSLLYLRALTSMYVFSNKHAERFLNLKEWIDLCLKVFLFIAK